MDAAKLDQRRELLAELASFLRLAPRSKLRQEPAKLGVWEALGEFKDCPVAHPYSSSARDLKGAATAFVDGGPTSRRTDLLGSGGWPTGAMSEANGGGAKSRLSPQFLALRRTLNYVLCHRNSKAAG